MASEAMPDVSIVSCVYTPNRVRRRAPRRPERLRTRVSHESCQNQSNSNAPTCCPVAVDDDAKDARTNESIVERREDVDARVGGDARAAKCRARRPSSASLESEFKHTIPLNPIP